MRADFRTEGVYVPDALLVGNADLLVAKKVVVAAGAVLERGAVLGRITASGKYILSAAAAGDGSEVPDLILAEDVDAGSADAQALAYARGDFKSRALTVGAGHSVDSITDGLRGKGIALVRAMV